jgi:hypothetical protein
MNRNAQGEFIALGYSREPPVNLIVGRIQRWKEYRWVV